MLLERIPDSIRLTITRGKQYLEWTLKHLLDSLLTEAELLEDHNLTTQQGESNDYRKGPQAASALFTTKGGDKRCAFCLGGHPPEECKKVQDIKERTKLLLNFGRCFNCIEKSHRSRDCSVTIECKLCKGQHSSCLCVAKPQQASGGNQDRPTGGNSDRPGNNVSAQLVGTECRIALQTAQALIKGGTQGRVRVLFDSGSHRSFVTAKAALKYELPVERKEWITISTFGQKGKESGLREVVRFDIKPLRGGRVQALEAYVVPEISHISNEHVEVVKNDFPHLRDLWFSDVCQSK